MIAGYKTYTLTIKRKAMGIYKIKDNIAGVRG